MGGQQLHRRNLLGDLRREVNTVNFERTRNDRTKNGTDRLNNTDH